MTVQDSETKLQEKRESEKVSAPVRLFFFSFRVLGKIFSFVRACFSGFWLGILDRKKLNEMNVAFFESTAYYSQEGYNKQGLFPWEQEAVDRHFKNCKTILVGAAGGGREMVALHRLGFLTEGFECSPRFVQQANALLQKENIPARVRWVPPDASPEPAQTYEGAFLGWQVYSLIPERKNRISMLQNLSRSVAKGGPLFLSFNVRDEKGRSFKLAKSVANAIRFVTGKTHVEEGDILNQYYEHHFTKMELESELREAGFKLVCFDNRDFPWAVALRGEAG